MSPLLQVTGSGSGQVGGWVERVVQETEQVGRSDGSEISTGQRGNKAAKVKPQNQQSLRHDTKCKIGKIVMCNRASAHAIETLEDYKKKHGQSRIRCPRQLTERKGNRIH